MDDRVNRNIQRMLEHARSGQPVTAIPDDRPWIRDALLDKQDEALRELAEQIDFIRWAASSAT